MADLTDRARALAGEGRVADAIALLAQGCDADDARALFERAAWHLGGTGGPRDLRAARAMFRRAAAVGHVEAALIEVALTANGGGDPPDWGAALDLLRAAARTDPVARQHLSLVETMAIDGDGRPTAAPARRPIASDPQIVHFPALLNGAECAHVAHAANPILAPAMVLDPASGRQVAHPVRTSHAAAIGPLREDLVVRAINLRIAAATDTDVAQGEPLMVLRYTPGQEYRLHSDALGATDNQRILTVLVYLNGSYEGGETDFPQLDIRVRGRPGDAIMFANTDPQGRAHPRAAHAGLPVTSGVKWLATRWIRAAPVDPWALG